MSRILVIEDDAAISKKIEPDPDKPRYVQTVRGTGYHFAEI